MRYGPPSGSASKEAINIGRLSETGTKSWTSESDKAVEETEEWREVLERKDEIGWLGDQESNLGSKIQNLMSCP
jgi:hypothetical protein